MAHIRTLAYTRPDGTERRRYQVRWIDSDGRERARNWTRARDADTFRDRLLTAAAAGWRLDRHGPVDPATVAAEMTVAGWLDRWLDGPVRARALIGELAPKTAESYEGHCRLHLQRRLGAIPLTQLTVAHVQAMLADLQTAGLTAATARKIRGTLSGALTAALRDELVTRNVAQIARPPRTPTRTPSAFDDAEVGRIVAACHHDRLGAMWLTSLLTGLRRSELLGLRWPHVELDAATYQIIETRHRVGRHARRVLDTHGIVTGGPKSDESGRPTPLSPAAVTMLRRQSAAQAADRLAAGPAWIDTGHVFTGRRGTPLDPRAVDDAWQALLAAAAVTATGPDGRGRGLHELRRTFAIRLRAAGVALEDVTRLGRWTTPATLLSHYSAVDDTRLRAAADIAAGIIGGGARLLDAPPDDE